MTVNVGTVDRILRTALGIALLYLAFFSAVPFFDAPLVKVGTALAGAIMLAVASLRICPIYSIFGFKTCSTC